MSSSTIVFPKSHGIHCLAIVLMILTLITPIANSQVTFINSDVATSSNTDVSPLSGTPPRDTCNQRFRQFPAGLSGSDSSQCTSGSIIGTGDASSSYFFNVQEDETGIIGIAATMQAEGSSTKLQGPSNVSGTGVASLVLQFQVESPVLASFVFNLSASGIDGNGESFIGLDKCFNCPTELHIGECRSSRSDCDELGLPESLVLDPGAYQLKVSANANAIFFADTLAGSASASAFTDLEISFQALEPTCDDPNAKIPCVCEVGWDNPAGGNWFTPGNWDQNRVPLDRGEGCDNVFFDRLGGIYTVTNPSDAATANTLSVTADDVTLQDGGLILKGAPSELAPSNALTIEDAGLLRLSNYTIATPSVLVDSNLSNPGRPVLIVDDGASLEVSGRLLLGSDFGGDLLDIRLGGTVNSGPVEIGKSGSEETLAHVAGAWNMQRLELGVLGDAKILIDNGGKVQVNSTDLGAILGSVPGVLGTIELKNINSELAVNGPLELGLLGKGVASLESGAKLIASSCTIGGDDSQLNVDGASGNVPSLAQINGNLNVAPGSGVGSLNITNGGLVQVSGNALLGETNIAFLLLEGQDAALGFGAQMLVDGELILGQGDGAAKVNITNGGTLSAANGLKLSAGSQVSTIVMEKGTAAADTPPNLVAGGFTDIGELGKGEIFASDGATLNFSGNTTLGLESSGFGIMELNGVSPDSSAPTKMVIEGQLDIGFHGQGLLRMNDGAQVEVGSAVFIGGLSTDAASAGALGLTNDNSALLTSFTAVEDIFIGGNDSFVDLVGPVRLRSDNRIFLERNGRIFMTQNAVLSQQNGFIQRGGRIVVGAAQGNKQASAPATIEGDWSIEDPASAIELIAADTSSLLRVTGNVSLGGTLEIRFAEGIELNTDDLLGLIQFDGAISGSFANISFPNRSSDFVGEIVTLGNTLQLRVIVPGEPVVGEGEGEGEGEPTPPTGCDGCRGDSAPIEKALGDVLSIVFGLALLMGAHLHFRTKLALTH